MKKNRLLVILTVLSIVCYVGFSVCIALLNKTDYTSAGYDLVVCTGPYNMDTDSIDLDTIHKALNEVITVPFTVSIGKNYIHGYPDIIISTKTKTSIDTESVISELKKVYPELTIESSDSYSFDKVDYMLIDSKVLIMLVVVAVLLLCIYFFIRK